jgi:hypothetical protein
MPADESTPQEKGSIRRRYLADRILLILLYKPTDDSIGFTRRPDGACLVRMGPLARVLKLNSTRLYDQFLFLEHTGYIDKLNPKYKYGHVLVRPALPQNLVRVAVPPK